MPAWIQTRTLPASGTVPSVSVTSWIGRPCRDAPSDAIDRTRGWPASDWTNASFRATEYGNHFASLIDAVPGGGASVKRCEVLVGCVGTAPSGQRAYGPKVAPS